MRTTKRNVIILDPGETIDVLSRGAKLEIRVNPDVETEPSAPEFEIVVPHGNMLANMYEVRPDGGLGAELYFSRHDGAQEAVGPLSFITFAGTSPPQSAPEYTGHAGLTVEQLRKALMKFPGDWMVHLDVSADETRGWEGDRVVRTVVGVRVQSGLAAVALDGSNESA